VVDAADHLVRHNRRRVAKDIRSTDPSPAGGWTVQQRSDTVSETVAAVRAGVETGRAPAECAVLTRVNDLLVPVAVALRTAGIPVRTETTGAGFLGRAAVRASLAWLRLAAEPAHLDPDDLAEAVRRPSRGLSERLRGWIAEQRELTGLTRLAGRLSDAKDTEKVLAFVDDVQLLAGLVAGTHPRRGSRGSAAPPGTTVEVLTALVEQVGLGGSISRLDDSRRGMNQASQADDVEALLQLGGLQPDPRAFPGWLGEQLRMPSDPLGVTLATVHRVKGQEWPLVVVHHVDAQQFPHRLSDDVEEERRVFHVAVTRTSGDLVIVTTPTPSPFVAELTADPPPPGSAADRWAVRPPASGAGPRSAARAQPEVVLDADGDVLLAVLKDLRRLLADGKPAYVVATDVTLRQIAAARPRTTAELLRVPGMGPKKVELYGSAIVAAVAKVDDALGPGDRSAPED
jgi:DNA helicase-2/ATP-dependent DNA helicase PcrA